VHAQGIYGDWSLSIRGRVPLGSPTPAPPPARVQLQAAFGQTHAAGDPASDPGLMHCSPTDSKPPNPTQGPAVLLTSHSTLIREQQAGPCRKRAIVRATSFKGETRLVFLTTLPRVSSFMLPFRSWPTSKPYLSTLHPLVLFFARSLFFGWGK
jgi:hypothetical protein